MKFEEIKHALPMIGFAFLPILASLLTFQCGITSKAMHTLMAATLRSRIASHDFAPLFNYYTAWTAHMLVSIGVALLGSRSTYRDISEDRAIPLQRFAVLATLLTMFNLLVLDALHCNLALLSHERIFDVLARDPSLLPLFQQKMLPWCDFALPTYFSLFPIISIGAAFWATATIIMCTSKTLVELKRAEIKAEGDPEADAGARINLRIAALSNALEILRIHALALSLVLVTSTLATVAYLRIPLGLLADADRRNFKVVSDAVGLVWGVTFSLTLLALCVWPSNRLRAHLRRIRRKAQVTHSGLLDEWLRENRGLLQVSANLQLVLSVLLPATVAVVANLVSS